MKIENSFIGGCLYAIGYIFCWLLIWAIAEMPANILKALNINMTGIEYLAYVINGFSTSFEFFKIHIFILKVIFLNLLLFLMAVYMTAI